MKPPADDPRITAYVLGELTPEEAEAFEKAAQNDPDAQAAAGEIHALCQFLTETLPPAPKSLRPAQQRKILLAALAPSAAGKVVLLAGTVRAGNLGSPPWLRRLS